ncbi:MAG: Fic family protein [Kiritimatiellae bacterium]|nr:Fic family protein [Kiritimatiellia bacterium]
MEQIDEILEFLHYHPNSKRTEVEQALPSKVSAATMKRILADGVVKGLVAVTGQGKSTTYSITPRAHLLRTVNLDTYYAQDIDQRQVQTGYNFELIRETMPAVEIFTPSELNHLTELRAGFVKKMAEIPEGAYKREMERLGIDLSWKSAQIEGNTYTLLETETLLKDLQEAKGRKHEEAVMLLNHKSALKAILERPEWFERISVSKIEDLHTVLTEGLDVERNLRHASVGITGTRYRPLDGESQIREAVEDMCVLINGKAEPYEKALLALLLIAYIQPFMDGNKRTSRLIANAILVAAKCCPLSFRTVDANDYRAALLLFYEQNNISAFKRMFLEQVEFALREYF